MDHNIGKIIRYLREEKRISQDQLARQTSLSKGLISQIENNKVIPSLSNLKKIADVFDTELSKFFFYAETDLTQNCIVIRKNQQQSHEEKGVKIRELIKGIETTSILPCIIEIEIGQQTKVHRHEGMELIYIISGKIRLETGRNTYELNNGDYAVLKGIIDHNLENITPSKVQILCINIEEIH